MKEQKQELKKLCNILHPDEIYYTNPIWKSNVIDGVVFLPVITTPEFSRRSYIKFVRKDSLKSVK